ncbi:MAG: delta-60 repeat domain-containing protein, partial [Bacteroidia bacterium]
MKKQLLATALMVATFAQAQEGTLDNTFATGGVFKTEENHSASKSAIQADGKILLCGSKYDANGTDFGIFRHNTNGSPDLGFGTNGAVVIDFFGKTDVANGIAVTDGGKILVAGTVTEGTTKKYALVRLNSDGSLDNTFGTSGKVVANISGATSLGLTTFTVASNGNIMLGGTADGFSKAALVVFKNTGELDVTFDTDGILQPSSMVEIQSIKLQTDGKILIGGNGSNFATIVRLNSDGSLDNTFGTNGKFTNNAMTIGGANTYIDLTPEGKIIGIFGSFASSEVNMLRLTSAGALDTEFGTGGKTTFNAVNGNEYPTAIKVQVNGQVLVIGSS